MWKLELVRKERIEAGGMVGYLCLLLFLEIEELLGLRLDSETHDEDGWLHWSEFFAFSAESR
jgi:hypothetical protein